MTIVGAQSPPASRDREWELEWSELTSKGVLLSHQLLKCHRSIEKMTHHRERCDVMEQPFVNLELGTGGVQGHGKGQRLMGIKGVNDSIGLATCQSKIF